MKYITLIIATAFIFISLFFGLNKKDKTLNSPLLNKPIPEINLDSLKNEKLNESDFKKEILLVNFFASWCKPCLDEHIFITHLSKEKGLRIIGINHRDNPDKAIKWLKKLGNPYSNVLLDSNARLGIDWGVYGIPETFIVNSKGIIKYRLVGPITKKNYNAFNLKVLESEQ